MVAVGFDLYMRLVNEAVRELREGKSYSGDVRIESSLNAHLPDDYVADADQKMALYQRMGHIDRRGAVREFERELRDRFGPPPDPVSKLLLLLELKVLAQASGVSALKLGPRSRVEFQEGAALDRRLIASLVERFGRSLLFKGQSPLTLELKAEDGNTLDLVRLLLESLEGRLGPLPSDAVSL